MNRESLVDLACIAFVVMFGAGIGAAAADAAGISFGFLGAALALGGYILYHKGI